MHGNHSPCGECEFYDPILRGLRETKLAWCSKKSVYPQRRDSHTLPPPAHAKVAAHAKPVIVSRDHVEESCTQFVQLTHKRDKAGELKRLVEGSTY